MTKQGIDSSGETCMTELRPFYEESQASQLDAAELAEP